MRTLLLALGLTFLAGNAHAQQLDVEFQIIEDGQAAGCAGSYVAGLDPNGDGFLAGRKGPGTQHSKIDELYNGDMVQTCAQAGRWIGVYYGEPRRKGWVHGNWLIDGAG